MCGITVRRYGDVVMGSRRHLVKTSNKTAVAPGESDQLYESDDRQVRLVFNGELYNFAELRAELKEKGVRFDTEGDTEVWLRLYEALGERVTDDSNMVDSLFSLAIHDARKAKLLITRDWPGRIPLFYYYDKARRIFLFSSELKGFAPLAFVPRADPIELKPGHIAALDLATFDVEITQRFKPTPAQDVAAAARSGARAASAARAQRAPPHHGRRTDLHNAVGLHRQRDDQLLPADVDRLEEHLVSADVLRVRDRELRIRGRAPCRDRGRRLQADGACSQRDARARPATGRGSPRHHPHLRDAQDQGAERLPAANLLLSRSGMHADGFKVTIGGHGVDELLGAYDAWKELSASHKVQVSTKSRLTFINNVYENMMRRASIIFMKRGPIEARFPFLETRVAEYMLGINQRWLSISAETAEFLARQIEDRAGPRSARAPTVAATYDYVGKYLDSGAKPPKDADPTLVYEMDKLFWKLPLMVAGMHASADSFLPLHVLFSPKLRGPHGSGITSLEPMVAERYRDLDATDGDIFKAIVRDAFNLPQELDAAQ